MSELNNNTTEQKWRSHNQRKIKNHHTPNVLLCEESFCGRTPAATKFQEIETFLLQIKSSTDCRNGRRDREGKMTVC